MKTKTHIKAGGYAINAINHNETLVRDMPRQRSRV